MSGVLLQSENVCKVSDHDSDHEHDSDNSDDSDHGDGNSQGNGKGKGKGKDKDKDKSHGDDHGDDHGDGDRGDEDHGDDDDFAPPLLSINTGAGNDTVELDSVVATGAGVRGSQWQIDLGTGNNKLTMKSDVNPGFLNISAEGTGNNVVTINGSTFAARMR